MLFLDPSGTTAMDENHQKTMADDGRGFSIIQPRYLASRSAAQAT